MNLKRKNILVTGANGQLGSSLALLANINDANFFFTDVDSLDITDKRAVEKYFADNQINLVVNCAAYTNVDKAEDEKSLAEKINSKAVENLAQASKKSGAFLIHISTDYVFGGDSANTPYKEGVTPNPLGVYGKTKLQGENKIISTFASCSHALQKDGGYVIIRTSWLYSEYGKNFLKTMLTLMQERESLKVVYDQVGTPTYAHDLARAIYVILKKILKGQMSREEWGIYNYSNEGVCSWFDFATEIKKLSKSKTVITPCRSHEFPSKVVRPNYSVLDKSKIKETFGVKIPHWTLSLRKCYNNIK